MNIKCPGCGQTYRVDAQRIPAVGASVRCKQCNHGIPVFPEGLASEPTRVIVCSDCAKQYRIDESKIPLHLEATGCRACGGAIPLIKDTGPAEMPSEKAAQPPEASGVTPEAAASEVAEVCESAPQTGLLQKPWFRVAGIGTAVLLLGVCVWVFTNLSDHGASTGEVNPVGSRGTQTNQVSGQTTDTISATQAFAGGPALEDLPVTPVAAVTLRVPALLQAVQGSAYLAELPPAAQMAMMTLATLSLGSIDLFVCQDEAGALWPALRVEKPRAQLLAGQFGPGGPLAAYFVQKDEFTFQLNEPVITGALLQVLSARGSEGTFSMPTQDDLSTVPLYQFAVVLKKNRIWLAPDCVMSALARWPGLFEQASLMTWLAPSLSKQDLLRVGVCMPGDSDTAWMTRVLDNEFVQAHPETGLDSWARLFEAPVTSLLASASDLDELAMTLACPTAKERRLTWIQHFRDVTLAQSVYEKVKAESMGSLLDDHPLGPLVSGIMSCPEIQQTVDLNESRMTVTCLWQEADDLAIIKRLGQGVESETSEEIGSSELPKDEPVGLDEEQNAHAAEWLQAVGLTRHLDESTWREQLPARFVQALMPMSRHEFGSRDAVLFEVEPWGDNDSLASVHYRVTEVISHEGQALDGVVGRREPMVGRRIRVPLQHRTQGHEALIQFDVRVPSELDSAVLDVSTGHEVVDDMATGSVAIAKVGDQTVRLVYRDMSLPFVYAFDRLGNTLRRNRISRESDGVYLIFDGVVETCLIVGVQAETSHVFEARINLNPGQPVELSYEPESPPYTRFERAPLVNYAKESSLDVHDLAVQWHQEGQSNHFTQVLSLALPENIAVRPNWEVYAHRRDSRMRLNGASVVGSQHAAYLCHYRRARKADQVSGSVSLSVFGQIERVTFRSEDLDRMCCVQMPGATYLDLHLDKNRLSYTVLGGDVVQLAAYDDQGRRLKEDPAWRFRQGMKQVHFWGVPDKVVLDISTQTEVTKLDFKVTEPLKQVSLPLYTILLPKAR
ncbi:MAG: hypothetical protein GY809_31870 [Planctomycetes bacterium]|nr:hypothetical protein [Planctomycetota bacterium]